MFAFLVLASVLPLFFSLHSLSELVFFFLRPLVLFFFLRVIAFCTIKKVDLLIKAKYADKKIGLKKNKFRSTAFLFA